MTICKQGKDAKDSHLTDNWGRFATKLYSTSRCNQDQDRSKDNIWIYVAISVVYFFLIGIVLLILLLAPKLRPTIPEAIGPIASDISLPPPELSLADESQGYAVTESKESFQAEPKDYDIDPRSPIFRGYKHRWQDEAVERLRVNSKFLQD